MKRLCCLLAALALSPFFSCEKADVNPEALAFKAAIEPTSTRCYIGDEAAGVLPVLWSEGDVISVNGTLAVPLTASAEGVSEVEFRVVGASLAAPYHLIYPGEEGVSSTIKLDGTLPPMYAAGDDTGQTFTFHQASAALRFTISGNLAAASVSLSAPGGEGIVGRFGISFSDGSLSPVSASPVWEKIYDTPKNLSAPESFTLFVAPGTYSNGLMITVEDPSGGASFWLFAKDIRLLAGKLYTLPDLSFNRPFGGWYVNLEEMDGDDVNFEL